MIQPTRGDFVFSNLETLAAFHFAKLSARGDLEKIDRKVWQCHLRLEYQPERVPPEQFRAKTVELNLVVLPVQGREKRQALNMVPVVMGDEDVRSPKPG